MNERIKELRKNLKLTQQEFGNPDEMSLPTPLFFSFVENLM